MKRLAFLLWGLAVLLALVIIWQARPASPDRGASAQVSAPELLLWHPPLPAVAPAAPPAVSVAEPVAALSEPVAAVAAPAAAPVPAATACARLGIFPDADWAGQVGLALLPKSEPGEASWAVRAYPRHRYYVIFSGLDPAALALRLEAHRAQLRQRVSASAHPEPCF